MSLFLAPHSSTREIHQIITMMDRNQASTASQGSILPACMTVVFSLPRTHLHGSIRCAAVEISTRVLDSPHSVNSIQRTATETSIRVDPHHWHDSIQCAAVRTSIRDPLHCHDLIQCVAARTSTRDSLHWQDSTQCAAAKTSIKVTDSHRSMIQTRLDQQGRLERPWIIKLQRKDQIIGVPFSQVWNTNFTNDMFCLKHSRTG